MSSTVLKQENNFSRDSLHSYQVKASEFIKSQESCALWVDMGLGKTVATLTAIADLMDSFTVGRVLVIAPLRVAVHTWPQEIERWEHVRHLSYAVACGNWGQRKRALEGNEDIHIINRENIPWLIEHLTIDGRRVFNWQYDMVVIDESSSFKSSKSKRFKALKKALPKIDRLVELTGTPASNGLLDIWAQIFLVDKGERLGKTFRGFRNCYFTCDYMGYNWELRPDSKEKIYKRLRDICLTLSAKDYLDLPKRIDNVILIDFSKKETQQYRELEREFLLELENSTVEAFNAASLSNKLLQFSNGAVYTDDKGNWEEIHKHKLDALKDIIEEAAGQPVLVAYNFKSDRARIKQYFKNTVAIDEDGAVERWNAGKIPLLIAHPASAGHGLNLQYGGAIVVWFGLNWSLELYQQFNARLHRQGQTKPVFIHHVIVEDTIEKTVLSKLKNKNTTQRELLEALKEDIKNAYAGQLK